MNNVSNVKFVTLPGDGVEWGRLLGASVCGL